MISESGVVGDGDMVVATRADDAVASFNGFTRACLG